MHSISMLLVATLSHAHALHAATLARPAVVSMPSAARALRHRGGAAMNVKEAVKAGTGAFVGFGTLSLVTKRVLPMLPPGDVTVLCPPLGALAVILFCMPDAPAAQPRALVFGHLIGGLSALLVSTFAAGNILAPGAAVALAITGMKLFSCVHPPAAAYAFLFALQGWTHPKRLLYPGLLGAVLLLIVQRIYFAYVSLFSEYLAMYLENTK